MLDKLNKVHDSLDEKEDAISNLLSEGVIDGFRREPLVRKEFHSALPPPKAQGLGFRVCPALQKYVDK